MRKRRLEDKVSLVEPVEKLLDAACYITNLPTHPIVERKALTRLQPAGQHTVTTY